MTLKMNLIIIILITTPAANAALKVAVETTGSPKYSEPHKQQINQLTSPEVLHPAVNMDQGPIQDTRPGKLQELRMTSNSVDDVICENMQGIDQVFCLSVLGEQSKGNMAFYKSARRDCNWVPFRGHFFSLVSEKGSTEVFASFFNRSHGTNHETQATSCKIAMGSDEFMHIFRIGPFKSHGDADKWYRFGMEDLMPEWNQKHVGVRGYLQAAVDGEGSLIGYPPIQLHHIHFTDEQCNLMSNFKQHLYSKEMVFQNLMHGGFPVWADTHTDKQCSEAMGGINCLIRTFPAGFAEPMNLQKSGCFFGDFMDVRSPGSSQLTWWVEHMVHVSTSTFRPLSFHTVGTGGTWSIERGSGNVVPNGEFIVDAGHEMVVWSKMNFFHDGRVVLTLKHTHRLMTEDIIFIRGDPVALGLPNMQLPEYNGTVYDISPNLLKLRKQILKRVEELQSRGIAELLCSMRSQHNSLENASGFLVDRMLPLPCSGWKYNSNETFTFIAFLRAQKDFTFPKQRLIAMHSAFYLYSIPENGDPSDFIRMEGMTSKMMSVAPQSFSPEVLSR